MHIINCVIAHVDVLCCLIRSCTCACMHDMISSFVHIKKVTSYEALLMVLDYYKCNDESVEL